MKILREDDEVIPLFQLKEMTVHVGAEITGIDIASGVSEELFIALRDAIHRYSVIVIRDQNLTPAAQLALVKRLGPMPKEPYTKFSVPDAPELMLLSNIKENGKPIGAVDVGGMWHTDKLHTRLPNMYTMLHALQVPVKNGVALGDTLFTSVAEAYDALSDAMKQRLLPLKAIHNLAAAIERKRKKGVSNPDSDATPPEIVARRQAEHPVVAVHPITGRRCLMVTEGFTARIIGMPESESDALLEELWAHIVRPDFVYRHSWRVGDLLIWDNRSSQHLATFDYDDIPRRMHRGETMGPPPKGIALTA